MTIKTRLGRDLVRGITIACVLALVVAVALWWTLSGSGGRTITAYFGEVVGLYPGSDVRVLGLPVGTVDSVTPQPGKVKVEMTLDRDVKVPASSPALIVAPALVSDRYVAFESYRGGPVMRSGTVLPMSRTQEPAEVDQLYANLTKLAKDLGPQGANAHGALSDLLHSSAANLHGNGQALHNTIAKLGDATRTLNGNQQDLFDTVTNLAKFTTMLQDSDAQVRDFSQRVADVSGFLASERSDLAAAVKRLADALDAVKTFVNSSHAVLKSNVDNLASVTQVLVDQRSSLAEVLDDAPLGLDNLYNSYNAASGTLDARMNLNELNNPPIITVCKLLRGGTPQQLPQSLADACDKLAPVVQGLVPLPSVADVIESLQQGRIPQLPEGTGNPILNSMNGGR